MTLVISKGITLRKDFAWNETIWNPSMISTSLWLDAADASTITESGGAVSQWNDKSGNQREANQDDSDRKPLVVSAEQNGRAVVRFDGSNHFMSLAKSNDIGRNLGGMSIVAVRRCASLPTTARDILRINIATSRVSRVFFGVGFSSGKANVGGRRPDSSSFQSISSTDNVSTTLFEIQSGVYDYANSDLRLHVNGSLAASSTTFHANGLSDDTPSLGVWLGANATTSISTHFDGDIGEILAVPTAVSVGTRQKIEGYLAHKWGLTASLPNDHPYKTVGPTP
jgi:hypothetical protein